MLDHAITFKNEVQRCQRAPAVDHVILRDDLEPVHYGFLREDVGVMRNPQTDTDPVIREPVKSMGWHMFEEKGDGTRWRQPPEGLLLGWRRLGAVGGAGAFAFAGVLAKLLLGSAAIAFAGAPALAGVLFDILLICAIGCLQHGRKR